MSKHIGTKINKLTILETNKPERMRFKVECECGNVKWVDVADVLSGRAKSCGCGKNKPDRIAQIIPFYLAGIEVGWIADLLELSVSTVYRHIRRYKNDKE